MELSIVKHSPRRSMVGISVSGSRCSQFSNTKESTIKLCIGQYIASTQHWGPLTARNLLDPDIFLFVTKRPILNVASKSPLSTLLHLFSTDSNIQIQCAALSQRMLNRKFHH